MSDQGVLIKCSSSVSLKLLYLSHIQSWTKRPDLHKYSWRLFRSFARHSANSPNFLALTLWWSLHLRAHSPDNAFKDPSARENSHLVFSIYMGLSSSCKAVNNELNLAPITTRWVGEIFTRAIISNERSKAIWASWCLVLQPIRSLSDASIMKFKPWLVICSRSARENRQYRDTLVLSDVIHQSGYWFINTVPCISVGRYRLPRLDWSSLWLFHHLQISRCSWLNMQWMSMRSSSATSPWNLDGKSLTIKKISQVFTSWTGFHRISSTLACYAPAPFFLLLLMHMLPRS